MRNQVDGVVVVTYNRGILSYEKQNLSVVAIDYYLSQLILLLALTIIAEGKEATEIINIERLSVYRSYKWTGIEFLIPANLRRKAYEDVMKEQRVDFQLHMKFHLFKVFIKKQSLSFLMNIPK